MARRKSANNPSVSEVLAAGRKADEPDYENQSQEAEAEGAQAARDIVAADREAANDNFKLEPSNGQLSKADMVRQVLAEGITTPPEGVARIRQLFGIDLPKPMWSSYVAGEKRRQGGETQPRTRSAPVQQTAIPQGLGADLKTIKGLIETFGGADALKEHAGTIHHLIQKYGVSEFNNLIDVLE